MPRLQTSKGYPKKAIASDVIAQKGPHYRPCARLCQCQIANTCRKLELNQYLNLTRNSFYLLNYFGLGFCKDAATRQPNICRLDYSSPRANQLQMPRERIELPCLRLQCNALTAKPPKLFQLKNTFSYISYVFFIILLIIYILYILYLLTAYKLIYPYL